MNAPRLMLKHPSGWFAAGVEINRAMTALSDGAFKLFVYVCLHADRQNGQLRFRVAELAQATGKSVRSISTYLDELRKQEVCVVDLASNQHQYGRLEVREPYWPYVRAERQAPPASRPEQDAYIAKVERWFLEIGCVNATFSAADQKIAAGWYESGVTLEVIKRALLLGSARKYVSLFNRLDSSSADLIVSLRYFADCVEEAKSETSMDYWRYLESRVSKMEHQWRTQRPAAQENFAAPSAPHTEKRNDADQHSS